MDLSIWMNETEDTINYLKLVVLWRGLMPSPSLS